MAVDNPLYTDNLKQGTDKIVSNFAQTLNSIVSPSAGLYPAQSLHAIPPMNSGTTAFEFLNYGKMAAQTDTDRLALPKGLAIVNWSVNLVNNWVWDEAQQRSEPFDTDFPMIDLELGGEGVLCHYTAPGEVSPAVAFHEINRFGGSVDGLSGVSPYTVHVPFNQFKACIYAAYSATTTPDAGTELPWWGGSNNVLESVLNPLLWLNTEETKGSGYNVNELARFSTYDASAYPVINFEKSNGSYDTKTIVITNSSMGQIGSNVYDGAAFQRTAQINFVTRGTMSSGNVGQSIVFQTSATNTAGISTRMDITHDGLVKMYTSDVRGLWSAVTGVPSYSAATSFSPTTDGNTIYSLMKTSTSSGGVNFSGFTNVTAAGIPMLIAGIHGHTAPTAPAVIIAARKHNGTTNFADLAATEIVCQFRNNGTPINEVLANGNWGFGGITTPGALVHIAASTTGRSGLRVVPGAAPSSPANGDIWIDSTAHTMHVRIDGVTKSIDLT